MLQTYLDIEAIRFGDRLTVEYDCPVDLLEMPVPNFILQPLVENSIKHAVAPTSRPIVIRLGARREDDHMIVSVSDNGSGIGSAAGTGLGLANTRRRLEVVYGEDARLETIAHDSGFVALIRIPIRSPAELALVS